MSFLRTGILSAFLSRTISGTQLVLNKYIFFLRREERRGSSSDHEASWPALRQMREVYTSKVDEAEGCFLCIFKLEKSLVSLVSAKKSRSGPQKGDRVAG